MKHKKWRELVAHLLDDDEGVSDVAFQLLQEFDKKYFEGECKGIFDLIDGSNGRCYLRDDWRDTYEELTQEIP